MFIPFRFSKKVLYSGRSGFLRQKGVNSIAGKPLYKLLQIKKVDEQRFIILGAQSLKNNRAFEKLKH